METSVRPHDRCPALHLAQRYSAAASEVFAAWLHPALVKRWLFAGAMRPLAAAAVDAREGGGFVLLARDRDRIVEHRGTFLRIAPPTRLAFALALPEARSADTRVDVEIVPAMRGCRLELTHAGVPRGAAEAVEARWLGSLYGLAETLAALAEARTPGAVAGTG